MPSELNKENTEVLKAYRQTQMMLINNIVDRECEERGKESAQSLRDDLVQATKEMLQLVKEGMLCNQPIMDDEEIISEMDSLTANALVESLRPINEEDLDDE